MGLILSTERAVLTGFVLCLSAMAILEVLFLTDRFDIYYIATHSSRDLPTGYKFTAVWSGMQGSLLLWALILSGFIFFAVIKTRAFRGPLASYATAIMSFTLTFLPRAHLHPRKSICHHAACPARWNGHEPPARPIPSWPSTPPCSITATSALPYPLPLQWPPYYPDKSTKIGFAPPAAGPSSPGSSWARASSSAANGLMSSSAGADTGAGTRLKTPPSCPG